MLASRSSRPPGGRALRSLALLLPLSLLGVSSCNLVKFSFRLPTGAGLQPIEITLFEGVDPTQVTVTLDGADVTGSFVPGGSGLVGSIPVPAAGPHQLAATRPFQLFPGLPMPITARRTFQSPGAAPAITAVEPSAGAPAPRTAWLRFRLAGTVDPSALAGWGFGIECDGRNVPRTASALASNSLILNPAPELPAGASCRVAWRASDGHVAEALFQTAPDAPGGAASALYDRQDPLSIAPFPDDYYTVANPALPTGVQLSIPLPPFTDTFQVQAFTALLNDLRNVDGWSRQPPIVLAFSHPIDPSAVPADEFASQDPFAPVALVDIDPSSPDYQHRVPYRMLLRSDAAPAAGGGGVDNVALLFPSIDLREHGHYAVVATRRLFAAGSAGRPMGPSAFFASLLGAPGPGDAPELVKARASISPTLDALAALPDVPIPREEVAVAVRISIRTQPSPADLVYFKELALASPPPQLVLPDVNTDPCPDPDTACIRLVANRALDVHGLIRLPNFRGALHTFKRDPATGHPVQTGTDDVPFVMTLPLQSLAGPVIPVMYQHGNPGSPLEIEGGNNEQLDDAGFALLGIQDTLNRELGTDEALQVEQIFFFLVNTKHLSDFWNQTGSDMIFFLRAIQGLGALDLIRPDANGKPALGADGIPEIDPSTILYKGISEGGNNAQRFLPFAPELLAAEATVGGARLGETLIHQSADALLPQLGAFLPRLRPVELWIGLSLFQADFDPQDGHSFLRHLYREPLLPFAGSSDVTPPSVIFTQGIGDSLVPNNASYAMAHEVGVPHVRPVAHAVPTLVQVDPPLRENIAPGITAGFFQFDPATTPGCANGLQPEGHFCAQSAKVAKDQRLHFFLTALAGSPEIVNPF